MSYLEDSSSSPELRDDRINTIMATTSSDSQHSNSSLFSYEVYENENKSNIGFSRFSSSSHEEFLTGKMFTPDPASFSHKFGLVEYGVFVSVLVCSAFIGVFYACCGNGLKSTEEYLMGNRKMGVVPVSLSLLCSFVSAITVLGNPTEIYFYGSTYGLILISFLPMTLTLSYCYVPVYHNLRLSSAYEYLELRFSRYVRVFASLLGIMQYVIYMSIVVYGPSLAISQVTGIRTRMTSSVIFFVCIFYSTLGGLKTVVWTDSVQAVILVGSLLAIVTKGILDTGGFENVWEIAVKGDRTEFNFDFDPRVRHTVFTSIIGGYFMWLSNFAATHSQVQRYLAIPTLAKIRSALLLNLVGLVVIFSLCYLAGLALYARYYKCDPVQSGVVERPDQLLPLFVMETLGNYQGFPGLFVAGITCASLSSVSSGLNSLASILTYDYVKQWFPSLSDMTLLRLSKAFSLVFGIISFGFVFVAENLGDILPVTFSIVGGILGPVLGVFSLGMFFPWANSKGAIFGLASGVSLMIALIVNKQLVVSNTSYVHRDQKLPGLSIDGCSQFDNFLHNDSLIFNSTDELFYPLTDEDTIGFLTTVDLEDNGTYHHNLTSVTRRTSLSTRKLFFAFIAEISYMWYPGIGCCLTVGLGLLFSFLLKRFDTSKGVNPDCLSPPVLWLLTKMFPNRIMNWIEVDGCPMLDSSGGCSITMSVRSDFSFNMESMCDMKLKRLSGF